MSLLQWLAVSLGLYTVTEAPKPRLVPRQEPRLPMPMRISPEATAKARAGVRKGVPLELYTTRLRTGQDASIYAPAKPPPGVVPLNETPMAMDTKLAMDWGEGDWNAGGYGNSVFGEGIRWLGYPYLAELTQRAEYRRIVETMAREMTRRWIKIQATGQEDKSERVKIIEQELIKHKLQSKFRRLAELDGFYGRGHMYVNTGQDTSDRELMKTAIIQDKRTFKKGMLKYFQVIEPTWTYPGTYNANDPLAPDFYVPLTWYVFGKEVHRTRLWTFISREVPDLLKSAYSFGGISLSQLAKPYVDNWLRTRQSVSDITHSFSVFALLTNMSGVLTGGGGDAERERATLFTSYRDNNGLFMLDKNTEDLKNVSAPISGLDKLQAQAQEHMASVSGEPLVILTGIEPAGLNPSSDGSMQVWAQTVHALQEHLFRDHLKTTINLIQLDVFGDIDEEITFDFEPLKEESAEEEGNRRKAEAETDAVYITAGVIGPDEIRQKIANDPDSVYAGLDLEGPPPMPPEAEPDPLACGSEEDSSAPTGAGAVRSAAAGDTVDEIARHLGQRGANFASEA